MVDAERLLSHHVAKFLRDKNHYHEADYVEMIPTGMRQVMVVECCRANNKMFNYLSDEWMPLHK